MKIAAVGIVASLVVSLATGSAQAQQTAAQRACIKANNKSMAKVAKTELKVISACAKKFAYEDVASADDCITASTNVAEAQAKTLEQEAAKCTEAPDFGPISGAQVNDAAEEYPHDLAIDLFESSTGLDSGLIECAANKAGCKCQAAGLKAASKLFATIIKDFNSCKNKGIKTGDVPDGPTLANCVGDDAKGKIAAASEKLAAAVAKKCTAPGNAFPGDRCTGLSGAALSDCLVQRTKCQACWVIVTSDELINQVCDNFDDGIGQHSCGGI